MHRAYKITLIVTFLFVIFSMITVTLVLIYLRKKLLAKNGLNPGVSPSEVEGFRELGINSNGPSSSPIQGLDFS